MSSAGELCAAVLAGGLGTRLRPLTTRHPKTMAPISGRPFLDYLLCLLASRGLRRIVICLGYMGDEIVRSVGSGQRFGVEVRYSEDSPTGELAGTAGAIRQALPALGEAFWIVNGDTYLDCDYGAMYRGWCDHRPTALLGVYRNANRIWPSNVELLASGRCLYAKARPTARMRHIDAGLAIVSAAAFQRHPDIAQLPDLYERLSVDGHLRAHISPRRFYEINTVAGLRGTRHHLTRAARPLVFASRPDPSAP